MATTNIIVNNVPSTGSAYNDKDTNLLKGQTIAKNFGNTSDYIELHLIDNAGNVIDSNYDYLNAKRLGSSPSNLTDTVYINPEDDIQEYGFKTGEFSLRYNFLSKKLNSSPENKYFISEISNDRTEIRISNPGISNVDLEAQVRGMINEIESTPYYKDYSLNLGNNRLLTAVNIALDTTQAKYTTLIKLYEPLPSSISLKDELWVVETLSEPVIFATDIETIFDAERPPLLRSANFDLDINDQTNKPGAYQSINDIISNNVTSSYQELLNVLEAKNIQLNVDYSDYNEFIHFSSAKERVKNFVYKLRLIEGYKSEINNLNDIPAPTLGSLNVSGSIYTYQQKIDNVIKKFDGYENFLYFKSHSLSWPKTGSNVAPYDLVPITDQVAQEWLGSDVETAWNYGGIILSSSLYDRDNKDNLYYIIPQHIRENPDNEQYEIFVDMMGQHFDNMWLYSKAITDLYQNKNTINDGISKDLVSYALKSLGVKLYTNNKDTSNLFDYFLEYNNNSTISNPYTGVGSLPENESIVFTDFTVDGTLVIPENTTLIVTNQLTNNGTINNFGTMLIVNVQNNGTINNNGTLTTGALSLLNHLVVAASITGENYEKEIYKRIYHNLPLLLKAKGTTRGLRALISCFGVPSTILRITETGGKEKDIGYSARLEDQFTYGIRTSGSIDNISIGEGYIQVPWATGSVQGNKYNPPGTGSVPNTIEFRFKADQVYPTSTLSQSLFDGGQSSIIGSNNISQPTFKVELVKEPNIHTGSFNEYGHLIFSILTGSGDSYLKSDPINLPFFNGNYWTVGLTRTSQSYDPDVPIDTTYTLAAFSGDQYVFHSDSTNLFVTSSYSSAYGHYNNTKTSLAFGGVGAFGSPIGANEGSFKGTFQGIKLWQSYINNDAFVINTLNAKSYQGTTTGSALYDLMFYAPLGLDLNNIESTDTIIDSVHPGASRVPYTSSFTNTTYTASYIRGLTSSYESNVEEEIINQPVTGILDRTNSKTRTWGGINSASVLTPYVSQENGGYIPKIENQALLEVAFSPQNEINDDIGEQLGYWKIDDYIGNPNEESEVKYRDLDNLREHYFSKYTKHYNVFDYIRLIRFFDNSLFKMVKDYVPARANLSSGIVIKPHYLNRNKIPRLPVDVAQLDHSGSIETHDEGADSGGAYEASAATPNNNSVEVVPGPLGNVWVEDGDNEEFYTGELQGTTIDAISQSVNPYTQNPNNGGTPYDPASASFDEFNAILNNVDESLVSKRAQQADYVYNAETPTNFDLIISNSAPRAYIQPSYYDLTSWNRPRYQGSKNISANLNIYQGEGSASFAAGYSGSWEGDRSFGKTPAADLYSTHFVLFDKINIDAGFQDRDLFHCLYLIDDQGNKVPLSYKNKNLEIMERLYVPGDNVEVVFLGENNQSIYDSYPVLRTGRYFDLKMDLKNDLFSSMPSDLSKWVFSYEALDPGSGSVIVNSFFKFKGNQSYVYQFNFSPSFYSASLNDDGSYRLMYLNDAAKRQELYNDVQTRTIMNSKFNAPGNQGIQNFNYTYRNFDVNGFNNTMWDSKLEPWFILTYNPTTGKVFEGTEYEMELDFFEFKSQSPTTGWPTQTWAFAYYNTAINNPTEIPSLSERGADYLPIQVGDKMTLTRTNSSQSNDYTQLSGTGQDITDGINDIITYEDVTEMEITNIQFPGDLLAEYKINPQNVFDSYVSGSPSFGLPGTPSYWAHPFDHITVDPSSVNTAVGEVIVGTFDEDEISLDNWLTQDYHYLNAKSVHWMKLNVDQVGPVGSFDNWFDSRIVNGDIIELCALNITTGEEIGCWRYLILTSIYDSVNNEVLLYTQFMDGDSSYLQELYPSSGTVATRTVVKNIRSFSNTYIDVTVNNSIDLISVINDPGNALRINNNIRHEQYIESQYLSGSGVGIILPEDYSPELRERIPDIINKTGINIDTLN